MLKDGTCGASTSGNKRTNPSHRISGKKATGHAGIAIRPTNKYCCEQAHAGRNRTLRIALPLIALWRKSYQSSWISRVFYDGGAPEKSARSIISIVGKRGGLDKHFVSLLHETSGFSC